MSAYLDALRARVLVFDGAYGTQVQARNLTPAEWGGQQLEGANDWLVLHRPDIIEEIHRSYLEAGADVIQTTTFQSTRPRLNEWGLGDRTAELSLSAAQLARACADQHSTPARPRFVSGAVGPSGYLPSSNDPTLSDITWAQIREWYREQALALLQGGVDLLQYETTFDILELKAAISGMRLAMDEAGRRVPIQAQVTLDSSGRMLLGTDIAAANAILEHLPGVEVIGLNCSTGPEHMREPVRFLVENCSRLTVCIPNAGLPRNVEGQAVYDLAPAPFAEELADLALRVGVNAVGGCCGTTPAHIEELVRLVSGRPHLHASRPDRVPRLASPLRAYTAVQEPAPLLIGERVNSQGSRRVKALLLEDDYEGILQVARQQTEAGAHALDLCVALTERSDEALQMREVVRALSPAVDPPLVIDSTEPEVIRAALESYGGRAVVNSINLENGRQRCEAVLPLVHEHGAMVMALTIDESGMAKTAERKLEVARRIADIALDEYGLKADALIYDALTFTLATGDVEFGDSAHATIEGIRAIKRELPGVFTSLGVSNVSFGLSAGARPVLNSVFLWHCIQAGLDMAIINPAHVLPMNEIPASERELAEDLVFNRRPDALQRYIEHFEGQRGPAAGSAAARERAAEEEALMASLTPAERIRRQILQRTRDGIEEQIDLDLRRRLGLRRDQRIPTSGEPGAGSMAAGSSADWRAAPGHVAGVHEAAVEVLNEVLLPAMKEVGDRFGAGELILPFVLQSAEVMKRAVAHLENYLEKLEGYSKGTVVLATVFGDVHDIGKNLVHTILANNGFTVHDLGKQVPLNRIIETANEVKADVIGLSALLVSTSRQMPMCLEELDRRGMRIPVIVGGAAINRAFGRQIMFLPEDRLFEPGVFYCRDAFEGLDSCNRLLDPETGAAFAAEVAREAHAHRAKVAARVTRPLPGHGDQPRGVPPVAEVPTPPFLGTEVVRDIPLDEVFRYMDLRTLFKLSWGARGTKGEAWEDLLESDFRPRLARMQEEAMSSSWLRPEAVYGFFECNSDGEDLVLWEPGTESEIGRFGFPRQPALDRLCLADYFRPRSAGRDLCALQVVTVGAGATEIVDRLQAEAEYSESYFHHGLAVAAAEGAAEWMHRKIRRQLGLPIGQGKRYSWGYPACPDLSQQSLVLTLLPGQEIDLRLSEGFQLMPEQSTAALVVHHPAATYFSVHPDTGSGIPGA